jgi:FkbM family methyltransferase
MLKSFIKKLISSAGYTLHNKGYVPENLGSMAAGLTRLKAMGLSPNLIIDIGAADGTWTEKSLVVWPAANYRLVEPLAEKTESLDKLDRAYPNLRYHLAVAGEISGEVDLNVSPDLDGSGIYGNHAGTLRKVPVMTIDTIAAGIKGPVLIKFDTHGYEVPILKGATETLKRTDVLIIEVYGFHISPTCLLFHELSAYLDELGFRLADIVDVMRRPGDKVFWQADAYYLRKDNPLFLKNSYA